MKGFNINIEKATLENENFRKVFELTQGISVQLDCQGRINED